MHFEDIFQIFFSVFNNWEKQRQLINLSKMGYKQKKFFFLET